ncbi:MAG: hypothetical protein JHC95_16565 [Solirubrobacteraceae bacterium]|nr:hypothetical protein [Solirubrobacteraceae bacterium]
MPTAPPAEGTLVAYADVLSALPGEDVVVRASSTAPSVDVDLIRLWCGDEHPDGPGARVTKIDAAGAGTYAARQQPVARGSFGHAPLGDVALDSFTVAIDLWPTTPSRAGRQGLIACPGRFALLIDGGDLVLEAGGAELRLSPGPPERRWARVVATHDHTTGNAVLTLDVAGWPPSSARTEGVVPVPDGGSSASVLFAATALDPAFAHPAAVDPYDGKLEAPQLWAEARDRDTADAPTAAWDLGAPLGNHAVELVHLPSRPATGHAYTGEHDRADLAPAHYAACHFHADGLEDCHWEETATLTLPDDLPSGVYGVRLRAGTLEDVVPVFVRPAAGAATADVAILHPTVSYAAYANERMQDRDFVHQEGNVMGMPIAPDKGDLLLKAMPELGSSLYDQYADGTGVCFSSLRRPVLNMRPWHRNWQTHAPRALSADLYLADWLDREDVTADVLTDHDLHAEGAALLAPYRVVLTGCHPEYWTAPMLDALEAWLDDGGRLMYLGGNGFYWVTSIDPERTHVVELRRGVCGTRAWESAAGEMHHTTTGELGGLWRNRGRSPNAMVGVGFAAAGFSPDAPGYQPLPAARDPRAAFVFEGIAPDETIGDFGFSMGGAAGDEIDRYDMRWGSPPDALVLATSQGGHSDFVLLTSEDLPETTVRVTGTTCDDVRADIVLMPTANGGGVFSVGSIGWTAAMAVDGYDNNVARMTRNVLQRFLDPAPLELAADDTKAAT